MKHINVSIGQRLSLGFGLLLAMLVGAAVISALQFKHIGDINERIIDQDWRKAEAANLINATTRTNARLTMALLMTDDANRLQALHQSIDRNKGLIDEALATLDALVYLPEGRELLTEIKRKRVAFVASFSQVRRLVAEGRRDEATQLMNNETLAAIDALDDPIARMNQLQKDVVTAGSAEVQSNIQSALRVMVILAVLGLLGGIVAARLITRSITRPLEQAVHLAQQVAAGDLTGHIQVQRHDELGRLLEALQTMNSSLIHLVGRVRSGSETISTATSEIAMGNTDLSQRTEEQASSLEQIAASLQELSTTVQQNLDGGQHANKVASAAAEVAVRGGAWRHAGLPDGADHGGHQCLVSADRRHHRRDRWHRLPDQYPGAQCGRGGRAGG